MKYLSNVASLVFVEEKCTGCGDKDTTGGGCC